jgi:hypothetical protein
MMFLSKTITGGWVDPSFRPLALARILWHPSSWQNRQAYSSRDSPLSPSGYDEEIMPHPGQCKVHPLDVAQGGANAAGIAQICDLISKRDVAFTLHFNPLYLPLLGFST